MSGSLSPRFSPAEPLVTREMCIRWIKRMLAGSLDSKDDEDLKAILRRPSLAPRVTITVDVSDGPNVSMHTKTVAVSDAQIRPMLERAARAIQAEINALQACPYHQRRSSTGGGDG